jgi:GTP-binding protein EngB required for normal cell division
MRVPQALKKFRRKHLETILEKTQEVRDEYIDKYEKVLDKVAELIEYERKAFCWIDSPDNEITELFNKLEKLLNENKKKT